MKIRIYLNMNDSTGKLNKYKLAWLLLSRTDIDLKFKFCDTDCWSELYLTVSLSNKYILNIIKSKVFTK